MANNLLPIAVTAAGGILVYSSVKNISITTMIHDLIKGTDPSKDIGELNTATTTLLTGPTQKTSPSHTGQSGPYGLPLPPSPENNVTGGKSGGLPSLHGITEKAFQTAILKGIKAPLTAQNYAFLSAWMQRENTAARFNPLATTQRTSGSYPLPGNSAGVQQYRSAGEGIIATVTTLLNGYYGDVVAALRSGKPGLHTYYPGLKTWSGNGYASV